MRPVLLALLVLLATASASAQDFTVAYTFPGSAGNEATLPADAAPVGTTPSPISRGPGLSPASAAGAFSSLSYTAGGTLDQALAAGDYFEIALAPEAGYAFSLTSLQFSTQRSATGPQRGELRSSLDGFQSAIGSPIAHPTALAPVGPFDLSSAAFQSLSAPVTFRLYGYAASSASGTLRIDNIALTGTATAGGAGQSVTLSLGTADVSLYEGQATDAPTVTVTTTDNAPLAAQATVQVQFVAAGSTGQAADVSGLPLLVTIPAGTPSGAALTQRIQAVSDGLVEGTETVRLVLGSARGASIATASGTVTLSLSDPAGVQAVTVSAQAPTSATVGEGGSATATFRVATSDGAPVVDTRTVSLVLTGGEGLAANDFIGFTNPATLTVASGAPSGSTVTLLLRTFDDSEYEGTETFTFRLTSPSANTAVGTPDAFTLVVNDNDALPQVVVCPGFTGPPLLSCIRQSYTPTTVFGYDVARDTLFAFVDDGDRTRITDVYVGRVIPIPPGTDPTIAGCNGDRDNNSSSCSNSRTINTEHAFPQSKGASEAPAQGDMHHLYPARGDVNSARNNNPTANSPTARRRASTATRSPSRRSPSPTSPTASSTAPSARACSCPAGRCEGIWRGACSTSARSTSSRHRPLAASPSSRV